MKFTPKINKTLKVAAKAHKDQLRKGTDIPYIMHPVAVAFIISQYSDDEDAIMGGLLHDVLEDVRPDIYSATDMEKDFGEEIVKIVRDVSEDKVAGEENEKPWKERKEGYLAHLESLDDTRPLIISMGDKIHNLMSILEDYEEKGDTLWDRFNASYDEQVWYYNEFLKIMENKPVPPEMLAELKGLVETLTNISK